MKRKGVANLVPIALGMITLAAGVTMLFIMPELLLSTLNSTEEGGLLRVGECKTWNTTPAQCGALAANCCKYLIQYNAEQKVNTVRNIGMAVIIIALVWMIIAIVSGKREGM